MRLLNLASKGTWNGYIARAKALGGRKLKPFRQTLQVSLEIALWLFKNKNSLLSKCIEIHWKLLFSAH